MAGTEFDYIIVGGGSAGCLLALRLSADPQTRVLLLESGPAYRERLLGIPLASYLQVYRHIWDYRTIPQAGCAGREMSLPCGRVVGGGSSVNGMLYTRGEPHCYDRWADVAPGWSYDEVLPLFKRTEQHEHGHSETHGGEGPLHVGKVKFRTEYDQALLNGFQELGLPFNDDFCGHSQHGAGWLDVTQRKGWRCSASRFLDVVSAGRNLTVISNAHVTRLRLEGRRAVGVHYDNAGGSHYASCGVEVLLSAGAIASPKLLMLSGIGPATHLRSVGLDVQHHLPGVGENLQDHLRVPVYFKRKVDFAPVPRQLLGKGRHMVEFLATGGGLLSSPIIAAVIAFTQVLPHSPGVDCQFTPTIWGTDTENRYLDCVNLQPCLVGTRSTGRLRLASTDPATPPRIDPAYLTHRDDVTVLIGGLRMARELARTSGLQGLLGIEVKPGPEISDNSALEQYIRQSAETCFHPVGTCRMGQDDMSVVDAELRVRGLDGLRVIDASIMPRIVNGNTNAPTMMIAEKGADLVLRSRVSSS